MNANELLKHYTTLSYEELKKIAREDVAKIEKQISEVADEKKARILVSGSVYTCVAADGHFTASEWQFICDVFGYRNYDSLKDDLGTWYKEIEEATRVTKGLLTILKGDARNAFISLCLATAAVDQNATRSEVELINKILGF